MIIPWQQIPTVTLDELLQEYVSRDGTDYGEYEVSLQDKVDQVLLLLKQGEVVIVFDQASESCNLLTRAQAESLQ